MERSEAPGIFTLVPLRAPGNVRCRYWTVRDPAEKRLLVSGDWTYHQPRAEISAR